MKKLLMVALCIFLMSCTKKDAKNRFPELFPFVISYDGPDNASSMAHLLDAPAGKYGFMRVSEGRFVNDNGPVRLFATNLTGAGNFPTHEQAERLAQRLARFGINCVRLHHMDTYWKWTGIIAKDSTTQRNFDSGMVERLDYMISEFKKKGIYVDINLHVGRWWDERDGFTGKEQRTYFDKGLDNFEPRMIELQKEYAKKLLTHVNPYTGLSYADDPCVAMIEINNENALFNQYHGGGIDQLPDPYASEFRTQWNRWLRKKYSSTAALVKAWKWESVPLSDEQVTDGKFDQPFAFDGKVWKLLKGDTESECNVSNGILSLKAGREGEQYFPKIFRSVTVKKDQPYTLSFRLKRTGGEEDVTLGLAISDESGGWRSLGLHTSVNAEKEWKQLTFSFIAGASSESARIEITRFKPGSYEIDDLSFRSGIENKFEMNAKLETGTIPAIKSNEIASLQAKRDFYQFLVDTERAYWMGMYTYLKEDLKVKSLVSGTQLGYSPPYVQAELDYIDIHSYWCHPGGRNLLNDRYNWQIRNESMVNSLSTIQGMANQRILGKPFTVSEYNHPFPNQYGAEGHPMLCAYGRLQGWDGVFQYTYNHDPNFEPAINPRYFDMIGRTDVLAHFPACAAIFLRGDVSEAKNMAVGAQEYPEYFDKLVSSKSVGINIASLGFDPRLFLLKKTAVDLTGTKGSERAIMTKFGTDQKVFTSETGELTWNKEEENAGYLTVNTPNTKLFTGFPNGRIINMGNVTIEIGNTRLGWATVSLVSRHASGFGESGGKADILLTATGVSENKGMTIEKLTDKTITIHDKWGEGPVLVEGIPAAVSIPADPSSTKCYALGPDGSRMKEIPVEKTENGGSSILLKPSYKTIWYEIEIK